MECCKKTMRSEEEKKVLMNRLKRIEGQLKGVMKMVDEDVYCNDILIQASAISAAMNSFSKVLLKKHLETCVVEDLKSGNTEVIDELLKTLEKLI